ncbi:MAG: hypothetical protein GY940_30255 [bacterium]|nr:hypothetical protein [bacterium]
MKPGITKNRKLLYAILMAGIVTFLLHSLNYTEFRKFRAKLTGETKTIEPDKTISTFSLPGINIGENGVLLAELVTRKIEETTPEIQIAVSLNSHEIQNLRQSTAGKKKHVIRVPGNLLKEKNNILHITGNTGDWNHWKLEYLEIKNLFGFSTGLFGFIILDRDSAEYASLGFLPLSVIFIVLVIAGVVLFQKKFSILTGVFYKGLSIFLLLFLLIAFLLPFITRYRVLFSLQALTFFLSILLFPVLKQLIMRLIRKTINILHGFYKKIKTVYFPSLKAKAMTPKGKNVFFYSLLLIMLLSSFSVYIVYRQQYVGACDWYGYYEQGRLLRSGEVHLETGLNLKKYPSSAPLSYVVKDGKAIPQYPPGYPLLLALAGFVGLEYYVTPVLGILSVILMYLFIVMLTSNRWIGLMFSTLWAFAPIVVYGSTSVMSDLVATYFIMLALYLFYKEKLTYSALALGFSMMVRPTNILFCIVFLPLVLRKKTWEWFKYGLIFSIPVGIYSLYNWWIYGLPWKTGYENQYSDIVSHLFGHHLQFYLGELPLQLTPLILILALVPFFKRNKNEKEKHVYFYGLWFLAFLIFYCFWRSGGGVWWWTRFLLPGTPALFFLAALGMKQILTWTKTTKTKAKPNSKWKYAGRYLGVTFAALTLIVVVYFIDYGHKHGDVWGVAKGKGYYDYVKEVAETVPANSMVGSVAFSGILRLYTGIESFFYTHFNAPKLIRAMLDKNIPVYIIEEPWDSHSDALENLHEMFKYKVIKRSETGVGVFRLVRYTGRAGS